jgi:CelD/BcsL family acetyltransferase involved in cellulose biosynthesis
MRVVFSEDGRDFHRRDWTELVRADPAGTFFHTPAYLKLYWEEFGEGPEHLLLAFAQDGDEQVGAVAFERVGTTLRFLGGTEVTDYMGPVARPGTHAQVARALVAGLAERGDWEQADLRGLAEDSGWVESLAGAARETGGRVEETDDQNGIAPFLGLPEPPATFEDYLGSLPSKLRHEIRRKARRLESEAGAFSIVTSTRSSLHEDLDRFVALHKSSEGDKGRFLQPGMEIFFRRLGEEFLAEGVFVLSFLEIGGEKLAGTIGFRYGGRFSLYNSAFDRSMGQLAPGMVLVAEDIRLALEAGCTGFDMLKGDYQYKYRFGAQPRRVRRLRIVR